MPRKKVCVESSINAGLYIRVSSLRQVEEGYSLDAQERTLRQYCDMMGWGVYALYKDEGISGKRINRPGLKSMLEDVKAGKLQKVVILKLDRISRNTKDMLNITDDLESFNVALVSVRDYIDTSTATGKLMRTVLSAIAQFESDIASERTLSAKQELSLQGKFAGGNIPYGYDYDKENKEFIVNEDEADIVEGIYKDFVNGKTPYSIAKKLNDEGIPTKRGGKWQVVQVQNILSNAFYTGKLEWQGIINTGRHEILIGERQFTKVQRMLNAD